MFMRDINCCSPACSPAPADARRMFPRHEMRGLGTWRPQGSPLRLLIQKMPGMATARVATTILRKIALLLRHSIPYFARAYKWVMAGYLCLDGSNPGISRVWPMVL